MSREKEWKLEYEAKERSIILRIRATNEGKFRFKKRNERLDFGETFSTRNVIFDVNTYLEWQIGYDIAVKKVEDGEAKTSLIEESFYGYNKKEKYPYELSELLFLATRLGLLQKKNIVELLKEIKSYRQFIDDKPISVERHTKSQCFS